MDRADMFQIISWISVLSLQLLNSKCLHELQFFRIITGLDLCAACKGTRGSEAVSFHTP